MRKNQIRTLHGGHGTRLYGIWNGMKSRCYNPKSNSWKYYGARGIAVCDEWRLSFVAFRDWALANGYEDGLSIERDKNDLGYEPGNCRWIPLFAQSRNRRKGK